MKSINIAKLKKNLDILIFKVLLEIDKQIFIGRKCKSIIIENVSYGYLMILGKKKYKWLLRKIYRIPIRYGKDIIILISKYLSVNKNEKLKINKDNILQNNISDIFINILKIYLFSIL